MTCLGQCGSMGWLSSHAPKGCWFDCQSGYMPRQWAHSLVGGMQDAAELCFALTLMFVCLSENLKKKRAWTLDPENSGSAHCAALHKALLFCASVSSSINGD